MAVIEPSFDLNTSVPLENYTRIYTRVFTYMSAPIGHHVWLHSIIAALMELAFQSLYRAHCVTRVKTHNLLQVVNRREQCSVFGKGVNSCSNRVHISSMIAILFYVVSTDVNKVVRTARIMLDISIVSYHVEYIYFFLSRFTWLFFVLSREIKIHNISCKKFSAEDKLLYINYKQPIKLSGRSKKLI